MGEETRDSIHRLIRDAYRPFDDEAELAATFAEVARAATRSRLAAVSLHRPPTPWGGVWVAGGNGGAPEPPHSGRDLLFPIVYQDAELGGLEVVAPARPYEGRAAEAGRLIAKTLAYHLKRREISRRARELYGRELGLVGTSASLRRVDRFIERASQGGLPALLVGGVGAEAGGIALALHLAGPCREGPFVRVHCGVFQAGRFERQWIARVERAAGGTLLLDHIESLAHPLQRRLCEILEHGLASWMEARTGRRIEVKLLAQASPRLQERVESGRFYRPLRDQLAFLHLEIAPLESRHEDLRPLLEHYLRVHSRGAPPRLDERVVAACAAYSWPGDVAELSRLAGHLAATAEDGCVRLEHLARHAPRLLRAAARAAPEPPPAAGRGEPRAHHPALARALDCIAARYQERLSLAEVAAYAYVSGSHLEHLFRRELGTTFIRFLLHLRIARSRELLVERPYAPVTEIAGDVGFNDLRHFERTFKSLTGCTPRAFRQRAAGAGARQDPPHRA